jgi:hypothetical protein
MAETELTPTPVSTQVDDDLGERLRRLWRQGEQPDAGALLAEAPLLAPAELARVLRIDQRERWRSGEPLGAEAYLRQFPGVSADADAAVDLIFNEFLARAAGGSAAGGRIPGTLP